MPLLLRVWIARLRSGAVDRLVGTLCRVAKLRGSLQALVCLLGVGGLLPGIVCLWRWRLSHRERRLLRLRLRLLRLRRGRGRQATTLRHTWWWWRGPVARWGWGLLVLSVHVVCSFLVRILYILQHESSLSGYSQTHIFQPVR